MKSKMLKLAELGIKEYDFQNPRKAISAAGKYIESWSQYGNIYTITFCGKPGKRLNSGDVPEYIADELIRLLEFSDSSSQIESKPKRTRKATEKDV